MRLKLPWPLPALLAWAGAWLLYLASARALGPLPAMLLASVLGLVAGALLRNWWRRTLVALGFPLSLALSGAATLPAWAWLLPLAALLLLYPVQSWRDAPLFPTPAQALAGLAERLPLPPGACVLDAGCGLGHGLCALHAAYPQVRLEGIEWSRPLALLCRLRCPFARVRRGDMWALDWGGYQVVYLFQRPESMARAAAKAQQDMAPGSWLVSLAFELPGQVAQARLQTVPGREVWLYRLPLAVPATAAQATGGSP